MPLIERFTPGGNLYPDGSSVLPTIVPAFRRLAEVRDQVDTNLLAAAKSEATTVANTARDQAVASSAAQATTIAADAEARARAHAKSANAEAAFLDSVKAAPVQPLPMPAMTANFLTGTATQEGFPSFHDSVLSVAPARRDSAGRAIVERASANTVPAAHQAFTGAVLGVRGSGGSLPTGWSPTNVDNTNIKCEILSISGGVMRLRVFKTAAVTTARDFLINIPSRPGWDPGASTWGGFTGSMRLRVVSSTANLLGVRVQQFAHTHVNGSTTTQRSSASYYLRAGEPARTMSTWTQVNPGEYVNLGINGGVPAGQEAAPWEVVFEVSEIQSEAARHTWDFTSYTTGAKPSSTVGVNVPPGTYTALVQRGATRSGATPYGTTSNRGGVWHEFTTTGNTGWTLPITEGTQYVEQIHVFRGTLSNAQRTEVSDRVAPVEYGAPPTMTEADFVLDGNVATLTTPEKPYSYKHATNRRYVERWEVRQGDHFAGDNPTAPSNQRVERAEWMAYKSPVPWQVPVWHTMQLRIEPGLTGAGLQMSANIIVGQWHATEDRFNGVLEAAREPVAALFLSSGDTMKFDARYTDVQQMTGTTPLNTATLWEDAAFPRGVFVHLLQKITFDYRTDGLGRIEMWKDGVKVIDATRPIGFNDVLGPHWKQGIYRAPGDNKGRAVVTYANARWTTEDLAHLIGNPPPIS